MSSDHFFSSCIKKVGINPCVDTPLRVSRTFGKTGYIPVGGKLNDIAVKATLVPIGGGRHRFFVNGDMMKRAGVTVGDRITLALRLDTSDRTQPVPEELQALLKKSAKARATWARLSTSKRKEISRSVDNRKGADTRLRAAKSAVVALAAGGRLTFGPITIPFPRKAAS